MTLQAAVFTSWEGVLLCLANRSSRLMHGGLGPPINRYPAACALEMAAAATAMHNPAVAARTGTSTAARMPQLSLNRGRGV